MAVACPVCHEKIDLDEDELDEGDAVMCDECGADLRVAGVEPLKLESLEDEEEDEEEDEDDEEDEDLDLDGDDDDEEDEEEADWK
jgi:alpha-aminoadipate/glutamate carrier protein LysW